MAIIANPEEFYSAYMPPPSLPDAYRCRAWRTYDDATGRLTQIDWDIRALGTMVLTLFLANNTVHVFLMRASGTFAVPGNFRLVRGKDNPDGTPQWVWPGVPGFTIGFIDGDPLTQAQIDAMVPAGATVHTG